MIKKLGEEEKQKMLKIAEQVRSLGAKLYVNGYNVKDITFADLGNMLRQPNRVSQNLN